MRRRTTRILLVALSFVLVLASAAFGLDAAAQRAAGVDLAIVQVGSLARSERSSTVRLPLRANLLGATWSGSADGIELRAKVGDGRWSRWVTLRWAPRRAVTGLGRRCERRAGARTRRLTGT